MLYDSVKTNQLQCLNAKNYVKKIFSPMNEIPAGDFWVLNFDFFHY